MMAKSPRSSSTPYGEQKATGKAPGGSLQDPNNRAKNGARVANQAAKNAQPGQKHGRKK